MGAENHRIATILAIRTAPTVQPPTPGASADAEVALLDPPLHLRAIEEHNGLCIEGATDTVIAEFATAIDAVHCAVDIQQAMLDRNQRLPIEQRSLLRMGLHVGEIHTSGGQLLGTGVDIANGLEKLAVPGGICLSGAVYEYIRQKGHVGVEYAGEKKVANTRNPMAVYQVVEPGVETGHSSFWLEIKRRNVFRVGVAYVVVAWLTIQVADVILPNFGAPSWIIQTFISLLFLGFPVALVLAWIYELTPAGLRRSDEVLRQTSISWLTGRRLDGAIISLLVVAVVFLVYENYIAKGLAELEQHEPVSVAVLAFENHSADANDAFFAAGLADELLSVLSSIRELNVASRTASFYFKDKNTDIASIAATLMVEHVLTGSVRLEAGRVRVTAVLDNTTSGNVLWSETYEESFESILDIQRDIAASVARAIVPVLSPESQTRIAAQPTESTDAYEFYLRGRDYLRRPEESASLDSAIQLFERALGLDPRFAHAYAGLCEAHLESYEFARRSESFEKAELACHRALTLNNGLWEVHLALGDLYRSSGQLDSAIRELDVARSQQPNAVTPYLALARTYAVQNQVEQAEAMFRRAEEVEGSYWGVHRAFGNFLYELSRYDESIEQHRKVVELVPDSGVGYDNLGNVYLATGDLEQAISTFNSSPLPSRYTYLNRGVSYYYLGDFEKAAADIRQAVDLAPEVHSAWGFLGDAYRFIPGAEANALEAYKTAIPLAAKELAIDPSDWRATGRLGLYYVHTGRLDEANAQLEQLLKLTPNATAYYWASLISLGLKRIDAADHYLQQSADGGWSEKLLTRDPDLVALRGYKAYEELMNQATK